MKPKYILIKFKKDWRDSPMQYFVVKRLSGGYVAGMTTITKYEVIYPENMSKEIARRLRFKIKGNSSSVKGTLFSPERLHDNLGGIFKDIFEDSK